MKKNLLLLLLLMGSSCWFTSLYAQHDNLTNVSAEFMRTGSRTAAIDAADIVVYNPAGLVYLEDGFHINLANQSIFRSPSHTFTFPGETTERSYQQDSPDLLLPNIYLAYKKNKFSVYGGFYISGGGGSLDYPEGSINSDLIILQLKAGGYPFQTYASYIDASSFYMTPLVGLSYAITDKLSAAVSFKYILATNKTKANVTCSDPVIPNPPVPAVLDLEYTDKASGIGFTGSLNYRISENFNIAARYETKSALEFEIDSIADTFGQIGKPVIQDGKLSNRDLPASLCVGANINITEDLSAMLDFGWYFQKQADWDTVTTAGPSVGREWSEVAGDVARFAAGLGYGIGEKLQANAWFGYTMYQYDDRPLYYTKLGVFETVKANNWSIGLGGKFNVSERFNINLAFVQSFWKKDDVVEATFPVPPTYPTYDVTINNSISSVALGINILLGK